MGQITEGLLAGFKIRALMEELQFTRAQRAQFEADQGHHQTMNQLEEAKLQAGNNYQQTVNALAQTELDIANETKSSTISAKNLAPEKIKAEIAGVGAQTQGQQIQNALTLQRGVGANAAQAGTELSALDFDALATNAMEQAGVKDTPANRALWTQGIVGQHAAAKREIEENKQTVAQHAMAALHDQARSLLMAAQGFVDPIAGIDSAVENGMVPKVVGEFAKRLYSGGRELPVGVQAAEARNVPDDATEKALKEQIATELQTITSLRAKKESEGLSKSLLGDPYEQRKLDQSEKRLKSFQKALEDYSKGVRKPVGRTSPDEAIKPSGIQFGTGGIDIGEVNTTPKTQAEVDKIPKGTWFTWTDGKRYMKQ